ncbi:unnamed protein product [Adineta steineri]|uniref:Uncharacterized protein n=1 Tax=Adineta steineri TaxID=433720 RepID=A0A819BXP7_9BILA|nr:unnamed protein product [Adineta steineri]CAF3805200.1 unnamed protein product [Adineta steineri]
MLNRSRDAKSAKQPQKNNNNAKEEFCLIRWSDTSGYDILSQQHVQASPDSILNYETYTIEFNGKKRKGVVILKGASHFILKIQDISIKISVGTKQDCERLQYNLDSSSNATVAKPKRPSTSKTKSLNMTSSSASDILTYVKEDSKDKHGESTISNEALRRIFQVLLANGAGKTTSGTEEIHKVRCAACDTHPIRSDRYQCLNCDDIDLCGPCFERRTESKEHKSGHAFLHYKSPGELFGQSVTNDDVTYAKLKKTFADDIHESITCDGCMSPSVKGLRFKCDSCANYDLCQRCVDKGTITKTHKSSHPLIVIQRRAIQQIPVEDIKLGDELGSGAFGSVYKARWLSKNRPVACKVITIPRTNAAERLEKSFMQELIAYSELSGAYILKMYGFTASRVGSNKRYMLVMEYMSRGSLSSVIKKEGDKISLQRKVDMARNIASGTRKIHDHRMIHRDIRPDNILVNENYLAKIGDFGIARVVDPLNQHTQIGYQSYMPPEFYQGSYDQKLDIFTFGLTLNELFTSKQHSFQSSTHKIAFQEQSPIFDELIARCTLHHPERRPAAIEIEKTLDLYSAGFDEIVVKKHPDYMNLSTEDKDEIFVAFYQMFHPVATEFIRKEFPTEFLNGSADAPGVKVDKSANDDISIECRMQ